MCGVSSASATPGRSAVVSLRAQVPGWLVFAGDRRCVHAGRLAEAAACHRPAWAGRLTPHVLRHLLRLPALPRGMSLFAIQELLGHAWTGTTGPVYPRPRQPMSRTPGSRGSSAPLTGGRAWRDEVEPAAGGRQTAASEGQRIAAPARRTRHGDQCGEDAGLWSGQPNTVKLDELDVICAVLGCDGRRAPAARPGSRAGARS